MKKRAFSILLIFLIITLFAGCDTCNRQPPPGDKQPGNKQPSKGKTPVEQKYEPMKVLQSNVKTELNSVSFITAARGIVVGKDGTILLTKNGGFSWTNVSGATPYTLYGATMVDTLVSFAVGTSGVIARSINGGQTWDTLPSSPTPSWYTFRSVAFYSNNEGYIVGDGIILKTVDAGATWSLVYENSTKIFYGISYNSAQTPYVAGSKGIILKSTDGGVTWDSTFITTKDLKSIHFPRTNVGFARSNVGVVVGDGGVIFKTVDDGVSWGAETNSDTASLRSVFLTSPKWGHAVGNGGTVLRYNGKTWTKLISITTNRLNGVDPMWNPVTTCVGEDGLIMDVYPPQVDDGGSNVRLNGTNECTWDFVLSTGDLKNDDNLPDIQFRSFEVCSSIEQSYLGGIPNTGWAQLERFYSRSVEIEPNTSYSESHGNLSPLTLVMEGTGVPTTGIVSCYFMDRDQRPWVLTSFQVTCP